MQHSLAFRLMTATTLGTVAVFAGVLITVLPSDYALAMVLLLTAAVAAYRFPVASLATLVVVAIGPSLFLMTGRSWAYTAGNLGRFSLADAVITAMLLALLLKASVSAMRPALRLDRAPVFLAACYFLLLAWAGISIVRNLDVYGLHAVGQFRYTFLIAVVPAYAAVFLNSAQRRRHFLRFLLVFSLGVPLVLLPVIGVLKGWGLGPTSRFYPSAVSLGMLYGWIGLFLASERGLLRTPKWIPRVMAIPVAALLIADSHRSVWLVLIVLCAYFVGLGLPTARLWGRAASLALLVGTVLGVVASILRLDVIGYVGSRGAALVDPSGDATSSWRLQLWSANLAEWRQHPLTGAGFGGYYEGNAVLGVPSTLMPHSLYIETLTTMGALGLALLAGVCAAAGLYMWRTLRMCRRHQHGGLDTLLVELGLGVLFAALAYWAVYSFDYYSCLWIGLGLAAAIVLSRTAGRQGQA